MSYDKTVIVEDIIYGINLDNGMIEQVHELYLEYWYDGDELVLESWRPYANDMSSTELFVPDRMDSETLQTLAEESLIYELDDNMDIYREDRLAAQADYYYESAGDR